MNGCVGVALVNYKQPKLTIECIESIFDDGYPSVRIVVVDNDSGDGSAAMLQKAFEDNANVTLLEGRENLGFARATNLGMRLLLEQGCEHIMMLNNDTLVQKDMISTLVEYSEKYDCISVPLMYDGTGERIWYAGGSLSWRGISTHRAEGKYLDEVSLPASDFVEFATGCCMMIPKRILAKGLYLPEEYFLYFEDYDYSYTLKEQQEKICFCRDARLIHKVSSTTKGKDSPLTLYYSTRNRLIANKKHQSHTKFLLSTSYLILTRIIRCNLWIFTRKTEKIICVYNGFLDWNKKSY